MKKIRKVFRFFWTSLAVIALVSGCGGGGGSSVPATYDGKTTPAVLTADNAEVVVTGAWNGGRVPGDAFEVLPLGVVDASLPRDLSWLKLAQTLKEVALHDLGVQSTVRPLSVEQGTIPGECGDGYADYYINANDSTGAFSGTITFYNYCILGEGGVESFWNGLVSMEGKVDLLHDVLTRIALTFKNLQVMEGEVDVTLTQGSMTFTPAADESGETMSGSYVLRDNVEEKSYWIRNYVATFIYGEPSDTATLTGRYYDPDHGYVDITTLSPLVVPDTVLPTGGELVFTGSASKALLTFMMDETASLKVDTNNDGIFETDLGNPFAAD